MLFSNQISQESANLDQHINRIKEKDIDGTISNESIGGIVDEESAPNPMDEEEETEGDTPNPDEETSDSADEGTEEMPADEEPIPGEDNVTDEPSSEQDVDMQDDDEESGMADEPSEDDTGEISDDSSGEEEVNTDISPVSENIRDCDHRLELKELLDELSSKVAEATQQLEEDKRVNGTQANNIAIKNLGRLREQIDLARETAHIVEPTSLDMKYALFTATLSTISKSIKRR